MLTFSEIQSDDTIPFVFLFVSKGYIHVNIFGANSPFFPYSVPYIQLTSHLVLPMLINITSYELPDTISSAANYSVHILRLVYKIF
jgi:hypothetical protein